MFPKDKTSKKNKQHLSPQLLKKGETSFDPSENEPQSLTLPKIYSTQSLSKNIKITTALESTAFGNFYMKKDFATKGLHKSTKTEQSNCLSKTNSVWSESNFKFLSISVEKRESDLSFRKMEALEAEISQKNLEKMLNLHKFLKILQNFLMKIIGKFSFQETDQEIKKNISEFEDFLCIFFKECLSNFESLTRESKQKSEKIIELNQSLEEKRIQFSSQLTDHVRKINESTEAQFKKIHKKSTLNDIYNSFENQKLEKEIEILKGALITYERTHNIEEVIEKFRRFRENAEEKIQEFTLNTQKKEALVLQLSTQLSNFQKRKKINNFFFIPATFKTQSQKLEKDLSKQNEITRFLEAKIKLLEEENLNLKNKSARYREIALMQKEDYDLLNAENSKNVKLVLSLEKKMKDIKKKMGYNMELLNNLKEEEFENDNNLLKQVANFMNKEYIRSTRRMEKEGMFRSTRDEESEQTEENYLAKYQYYKPTFFTLIKPEVKNDPVMALSTMKRNSELKISPMFLATIRAILDAKYNEFMLHDDPKQISKFPDFVYSWLSTEK